MIDAKAELETIKNLISQGKAKSSKEDEQLFN